MSMGHTSLLSPKGLRYFIIVNQLPPWLVAYCGRTASCPTAPAQIPACGTTAPGSSEILASAIRQSSQKERAGRLATARFVVSPLGGIPGAPRSLASYSSFAGFAG